MPEHYIILLSLLLGACVTWFATSRYYQWRMYHMREEHNRALDRHRRDHTVIDGCRAKEIRWLRDELRNRPPLTK